MISADTIRESLSTFVHPEGGWGYSLGQPPHLEPTCLALLALSAEPGKYRTMIDGALRFLEQNRFKDGSYRLLRGRHQAFWPTSLVLHTQLALGHPIEDLQLTVHRLLEVQGRLIEDDPEVADMFDIDYKMVGWPWGLNTFSWVEPTSWACIAHPAGRQRRLAPRPGGNQAPPGSSLRSRRCQLRQQGDPRQADGADTDADGIDAAGSSRV